MNTVTRQRLLRLTAAMLLAAPLLFAACTVVDNTAENSSPSPQPVAFDAYVNRSTTRGGTTGILDDAALKSNGFGVFAYYTGGQLYNQLSLPNFMYNQQVQYDAITSNQWTYTPVKYWPNQTDNAGTTFTDHLSFFAYAPYTAVDAVTGRAFDYTTTPLSTTCGIAALTRVNDDGDPLVRYYASLNPAEAVDLCWASPKFDQTKPTVGSTLDFNFKHALAALNVQIDADVDVVGHGGANVDTYTHIYVRSITFEGFALKGQLNLNNTGNAPLWYDLDCDCDLTSRPITAYDGRRDSHEGVSAAINEQPQGLNPDIVQGGAYTVTGAVLSSPTPGVTNTVVNLFASSTSGAPIFVIPTNDPMKVTIDYDVETYDPKLTSQYLADGRTHGSSIKNRLTANITDGSSAITLAAGNQYTLHLHLGMTSVKADVTVTPWAEGDNAHIEVPK